MKQWTPEQWDNLQRQADELSHLMDTRPRLQENRAWQIKVRLAIQAIAGYQP